MVERTALKATSSPQLQQKLAEHEREIEVLHAALQMQREAKAAWRPQVRSACHSVIKASRSQCPTFFSAGFA